jgi:membrane protein DedA with SNARE-associated domain
VSDILAFVVQHAEIVLFLYVLADQLGVPIPAAPILLAAGGLAAAGRLSLPGAVGLGVLASLVADLIWYTVGRLRGSRVLGLLCRVSLEPDTCVRRTENVFLRHGVRFLLFAKFVPGLGTVGPPLAGIVRVGVLRFAIYSGAGAFLWAGAWWGTAPARRSNAWSPAPVSSARSSPRRWPRSSWDTWCSSGSGAASLSRRVACRSLAAATDILLGRFLPQGVPGHSTH